MRNLFKTNSQLGTLLLDSLTAIAILAIVFAVSYPNYARARQQAAVGVDAQQLDSINTAVTLYSNDNKGAFPTTGAVTATNPGASYMPNPPVSPIDGASAYNIGAGVAPAKYAIIDPATVPDAALLGNYKDVTGAACTASEHLAEDSVHGIYCAASATAG